MWKIIVTPARILAISIRSLRHSRSPCLNCCFDTNANIELTHECPICYPCMPSGRLRRFKALAGSCVLVARARQRGYQAHLVRLSIPMYVSGHIASVLPLLHGPLSRSSLCARQRMQKVCARSKAELTFDRCNHVSNTNAIQTFTSSTRGHESPLRVSPALLTLGSPSLPNRH